MAVAFGSETTSFLAAGPIPGLHEGLPMPDFVRTTSAWCFGCNAETRHEERDVSAGRSPDGRARRACVCVECGVAGMTVVELTEGEYNRLRRVERQLDATRDTLRRVIDAVLSGEELPPPFRRTEPTLSGR